MRLPQTKGLGRPPLGNETPTSRKRRAAATAAAAVQLPPPPTTTDSSASSSICVSEQSSAEIRPAVTFEPGANNLFQDEELDHFVQYVDDDGDDDEGGGDGSSQEDVHQVSFDSQDSPGKNRVGGVRGFLFGRKRRKKKRQQQQQQQQSSQHPPAQIPSFFQQHPTRTSTKATTDFPRHLKRHQSTPQATPAVIPVSPIGGEERPLPPRSQSLQEYRSPNFSSQLSGGSFDLDIDTAPASPRMAPVSPFTQDEALQAIDDHGTGSAHIQADEYYQDEGEYQQQQHHHHQHQAQGRKLYNTISRSSSAVGDLSVQAEPASTSSTAMVPYTASGGIEVVEHASANGPYSSEGGGVVGPLQRQDSWKRRLDRRDIYQRHYVPSRQELDELKDLEDYLGVFSSATRHRFAALWHRLVPPLDTQSAKQLSRRNLLLQNRQSSSSSMSSLSSFTQQQQQKPLGNANSNHAYYSIILKRGPIQFEQHQDYHCEWILLTRGFIVARPNFQFIPRFQAGDLWTCVVQVQPTNPLSITLTCTSSRECSNHAMSSSSHLSLTQLKQQQQYGCYTYELSCETPQEQAAWLEALRKVVVKAHDAAATNEKEMGGLGWQYRVVYSPFYTEAVTGNPIQKDKILAGSTGHIDLNALDSYNSYAPLHYATRANHVRVIRFLLEAGADVLVGDGYGRTPMYYAELHQLPETTIQLLETYGSQRTKKPAGADGSDAKDYSCQRKLIIVAMVLLLLACGASGLLWKLGMLEQFGIGGNTDANSQNSTNDGPQFADYGTITFGKTPSPSTFHDSPTVAPIPELMNRGPDTVSPFPTSSPTNQIIKTLPPTKVMITEAPTVIIRQSSQTEAPTTAVATPSPTTMAPTLAPSRSAFQSDLFRLIESASPDFGTALQRNGSPQQRAFLWLFDNANLANFSNERKIQRYALATLYYSTNGDEWAENVYWLSDEDECMWFTKQSFAGYPVCEISEGSDRRKTMVSLDLSFNNLKGTIPAELGLLSGLQRVDLDGGPSGFLTGPIPPELGGLNLLESFSARGNQLSGSLPTELGNWAQIRGIDLSFNNILGEVPATIGSMTWLTELTLEMNEMTGNLPPVALGQLKNLFKLAIGGNQFTGAIPSEIGLLTRLRYLYMELNQLSSLPTEIGNLENLNVFSVFENSLQGALPSELGRLTKLGTLLLRSNSFTSTIPNDIGQMRELRGALDLSFNELVGPIPAEIGNLTSLRSLYLQSNSLSGTMPPEISRLSHLNTLRVESNNIVGAVPMDVCDIFSNTYPNFYADCTAEIRCSCCTYCCLDGQGCSCQYAGTANAFLC